MCETLVWCVLNQVCETKLYNNLFKSTSRNYSLFCREKNEVLITQCGLDFTEKLFYFGSVDADLSPFSLLLAFYFTISRRRLVLTKFSRHLQLNLGAKSAAMIRTRANKGQRMFPWPDQQTFVGEEDGTSPKNVCIGG